MALSPAGQSCKCPPSFARHGFSPEIHVGQWLQIGSAIAVALHQKSIGMARNDPMRDYLASHIQCDDVADFQRIESDRRQPKTIARFQRDRHAVAAARRRKA